MACTLENYAVSHVLIFLLRKIENRISPPSLAPSLGLSCARNILVIPRLPPWPFSTSKAGPPPCLPARTPSPQGHAGQGGACETWAPQAALALAAQGTHS